MTELGIITLFFSAVLTAPLDIPTAPVCHSSASNFHPNESSVFYYETHTSTVLNVEGHPKPIVETTLKTKCKIPLLVPCLYKLKILEAEVVDSANQKLPQETENINRDLTAHDLRFEMHHGKITKILPVPEEQTFVLNIKRGILDLFQLTFDKETLE